MMDINGIGCKRIDYRNRGEFIEAWRIYESNFPEYERRKLDTQLRVIEDKFYRPMALVKAGEVYGILFYWEFEDIVFIEHFAIDERHRGSGLGTRVLREFCKEKKTVVLEIDPPDTEIAMRRKQFYERLGFCLNDYSYSHPGYEKEYPEHSLMIMSTGEKLKKCEFDKFLELRDSHTFV